MLNITIKTQFKRDLKRCKKRGKDIHKLKTAMILLQKNVKLPKEYFEHPLVGNWSNHQECHLESDWLLIYQIIGKELILTRTGSHSDLFD